MSMTVESAKLPTLLSALRLPTFARLWPQFCDRADKEGWPAERPLAALCELKLSEREQRRIQPHRISKTATIEHVFAALVGRAPGLVVVAVSIPAIVPTPGIPAGLIFGTILALFVAQFTTGATPSRDRPFHLHQPRQTGRYTRGLPHRQLEQHLDREAETAGGLRRGRAGTPWWAPRGAGQAIIWSTRIRIEPRLRNPAL